MTKLMKFLRLLQLINLLYKAPAKNVDQIGRILDVSSRSVYRYLDLLELSGFHIKKNEKNQYYIDNTRDVPQVAFSVEETELINKALNLYGKDNKLLGSIKTKLSTLSPNTVTASHINSAKNGMIVETLNDAINAKKQVILKKYQSINSQTISDRTVEPISIDGNYRTLTAFELSSKTNKTFVIDRIENAEITPTKFKHEKDHVEIEKDVFGFGPRHDYRIFTIHLELSLKAKILLTEEYPESINHIKKKQNQDKYIFKCDVNDIRPIKRFVQGMPDEFKMLKDHDMFGVSYYY